MLALFGPTGVGKTAVAIAVAERLRERGEDPVAVNCDSIQVYRGLEVLSGAASPEQQRRLEHRLLSFVDPAEEFSAGRYAELAHAEIDGLLAEGRRPIVVGGTGLYLRAALADLDLRPPVPEPIRAAVEAEIAERGPAALHAELPARLAATVDAADRKRIARLTELLRAGIEPHTCAERLWTEELRHPTLLVGLTMDREELARRIDARVDEMIAAGAREEAVAAVAAGASRTAGAALGLGELSERQDEGEVGVEGRGAGDAVKAAHRAYGRRQLTWMRKMGGVTLVDRSDRDDDWVAERVVEALGSPA